MLIAREDYVDGCEMLLRFEEETHKEGEAYSWETMDNTVANFTADITPLILAAHRFVKVYHHLIRRITVIALSFKVVLMLLRDKTLNLYNLYQKNNRILTYKFLGLYLLVLRNNYEILKMLLDRGATIPIPHYIKCSCQECLQGSEEDSLKFSLARINAYR